MFAHKLHYLLFLLFALILGTWSARTQLAELAVSSFMQDSGLKNVTTNIRQLDLNQSQLSRFGFSMKTEAGLFQLDAQDTTISYKFGRLVEGRLDSVVIKNLTLHYEDSGKPRDDTGIAHKAINPLKIIKALRLALREYLVLNTLSIQHITLNGKYFGLLKGKTLQLKSTAENETLYAELTLLDHSSNGQPETLPQLVISKLSANSLTAELRHRETSAAAPGKTAASLELNIHDKKLTGNYQISPQRLQRWLQAFVNIKGLNEVEKVNGTLLFNFESDKQIITTITAASDKLFYKTYRLDNVALKLKLKNATDNPAQQIQLLNGSYIKAGNFRYDRFSLKVSPVYMVGELTITYNDWLYKGGFRSNSISVKDKSRELQLKDIAARFTANSERLEVNGNFSPVTVPGKFTFALDQSLAKTRGKLSIKPLKPLNLNDDNSRLSQLLTPWPYPFDLLSGNIKLALDATWSQNDNFRLTTKIHFDNAGGNIDELVFSGLTFDHELELLPALHSIRSSKINLSYVDSGVTVSNISTNLLLKTASTGPQPQIVIRGLHGEIFGGSFAGDDLIYDLNKTKNTLKIKATNIDLDEIVKTQQLGDITATGRIGGFVPVEINKNGIFIKDGAFINEMRSGTIRYNPTTGTGQLKQNLLTGIALDALRDFRYSHLSAGINFTAEGRLTINLQLKGTSPELDTNRPVHLNINTEQNLLSLLKSLRYAQGVSEKIDNKVRRLYEKAQK